MNRYTSIVLRAYLPAAVLLIVALGTMVWISVAGSVRFMNGWIGVLRWLPPLALFAALVMAAVATLRTWRGQRVDVPLCAVCAVPLPPTQQGGSGDDSRCAACAAVRDDQATAGQ